MKKILAILLTLVLTLSLAACQSDEGSDSSSSSSSGGSSTESTSDSSGSGEATIDTSEHVTIRYMITGNKPTNGRNEEMFEQLNAILTEKVNAELEIYWIEWTDYLTNYNLTLASNDGSVDLVGTATDWLDAWPNVKKGAFLPLSEEMLATYAPQTFAQVSDEHWDMSSYNGDIYLMPEDNFSQWINHGFIYRSDWANEFGMTEGVNSWDDLGDYFAAVKANKEDVIPWDVAGTSGIANTISTGWITSHTNHILIEGLDVPIFFGSLDDYFTIESPPMTNDTFVDFAKEMKEWSDAGYWREDNLNYSGDTREEFQMGQTAVDQHHSETWYGTDYININKKSPGATIDFFWFGKEQDNLVKMSITHGATAIAASSPNPERALMVYDLIRNDEECYRLFNYGIEGIQYEVNEEGKMVRPEGYDSETDGIATNFWWGRNDDLQLVDAERDYDSYLRISEEYNQVAIDYPYGQLVFDTDMISPYLANMSNVYATYMPLIAFGKTEDAEALVEEYRQAMLAAGYEEVLAELQKQMDEYKAYLGQ